MVYNTEQEATYCRMKTVSGYFSPSTTRVSNILFSAVLFFFFPKPTDDHIYYATSYLVKQLAMFANFAIDIVQKMPRFYARYKNIQITYLFVLAVQTVVIHNWSGNFPFKTINSFDHKANSVH